MDRPRLSLRKRLLFAGVLVGAVCVVAEVVLRFGPDNRWLDGDEYWEHQYALRHAGQASGDGTHQDHPLDRHSPTLGWEPRPGFRSSTVNTNSRGLRGLAEHPDPKPKGTRRVVCIGDSFTFGEGVADDHTFCAKLDGLLADADVLNLGVHGYGTDQQYLRLLEQGLDRGADLVVLGFYLPDVERNGRGFRDFHKPVFRFRDGRLHLENVPVPHPSQVHVHRVPVWRSRLTGFVRVQVSRLRNRWDHADSTEMHVTRGILDLLQAECGRRKIPLLMILMPKRIEPEPRTEESELIKWAQANSVPVLNMRPVFMELPTDRRMKMYDHGEVGHWTPEAHEICARLLREQVDRLVAPRGRMKEEG